MLLDKRKNIALLHNPKTGGRFASRYSNYMENACISYINRNINYHFRHIPAENIHEYIENISEYTTYVVVRNPYDRFVSAVFFAFDKVFGRDVMTSIDNALDLLEKNPDLLHDKRKPWFNPQSYYMPEGGNILRYESLEDWTTLSEIAGFDPVLIKIKPSYVLTDTQKKRIANLYRPYDNKVFKLYNIQ